MYADIAVIGGGAAGFMAALTAKENGANVIILERKDRVLKKVLATGNGRCNYTNTGIKITNYYGENPEFAEKALKIFTNKDTMEFFEKLGIIPKFEENGKVYPLSLQASSVVDSLRFKAESLGIPIYTEFEAEKIKYGKSNFEILASDGHKKMVASAIILAAGGKAAPELGSNGTGFKIAENLGHTITETKPALVQLKTDKNVVKGLQGVKVECKVTVFNSANKVIGAEEGEFLFTEYGISGSVIFNLSYLTAIYNNTIFSVDFFPDYDNETLVKKLRERRINLDYLNLDNFFNGMLNKKLGQFLLKASGIEKLSLPVNSLKSEQIQKIANIAKNYKIKTEGTTGFKNAQVTVGGIRTSEVNPETMESSKVRKLYFAGEILDIFGDCGGYNLQWAWASGHLAGLTLDTV